MHLVTVRTDNGTRAGRVEGSEIVLFDDADVKAVLESGDDMAAVGDRDGDRLSLTDASLESAEPLPPPDEVATSESDGSASAPASDF